MLMNLISTNLSCCIVKIEVPSVLFSLHRRRNRVFSVPLLFCKGRYNHSHPPLFLSLSRFLMSLAPPRHPPSLSVCFRRQWPHYFFTFHSDVQLSVL